MSDKFTELNSTTNQHIKLAASLQQKKYREQHELVLLEGEKLVQSALNSKQSFYQLFATKESILEKYIDLKCELFLVNEACLGKIASTKSIPSLIAVINKPKSLNGYQNSEETVATSTNAESNAAISNAVIDNLKPTPNNLISHKHKRNYTLDIFLDNISDPGNLGSIIRTCLAADIENIYLSSSCADLFNPKTLRASVGSIFNINLAYADLEELTKQYQTLASTPRGTYNLAELKSKLKADSKYLMLVGSEAEGLSERTISKANYSFKIDINPRIESLNVLAATSVIVFTL
jgi:TrmH family RNA methyltransferase